MKPYMKPEKSKHTFYTVITGDVVRSSQLDKPLRLTLRHVYSAVREYAGESLCLPFRTFRGDGFQGVTSDPSTALHTAIVCKAALKINGDEKLDYPLEARIGIGIGTVSYLPISSSAEAFGEAFTFSGKALDSLKGPRKLHITTPWKDVNEELSGICALIDAVISRWTPEQCRAIFARMKGKLQKDIAQEFNVSQPAVSDRLNSAAFWALEPCLERFESLINRIISK